MHDDPAEDDLQEERRPIRREDAEHAASPEVGGADRLGARELRGHVGPEEQEAREAEEDRHPDVHAADVRAPSVAERVARREARVMHHDQDRGDRAEPVEAREMTVDRPGMARTEVGGRGGGHLFIR